MRTAYDGGHPAVESDRGGADLVALSWADGPPGGAARQVLDAATRADTEMTFGRGAGDAAYREVFATALISTRLRRWSAPRHSRPVPAGVITLRDGGDHGLIVDATVHPDFRSTGVLTASLEELLVRPPDGIAPGQAIILCAYGSHPAALRAARSFAAVPAQQRDVLVLPGIGAYLRSRAAGGTPMRAVEVGSVPAVSRHAAIWSRVDGPDRAVHYAATCPRTGAISGWFTLTGGSSVREAGELSGESDSGARRLTILSVHVGRSDESAALAGTIAAALSTVAGLEPDPVIEAVTDSGDTALTEALRAAAFEHDRSDVLFRARSLVPPASGG